MGHGVKACEAVARSASDLQTDFQDLDDREATKPLNGGDSNTMSTETNQTIAMLIMMALGCLFTIIIVGIGLCPFILLSAGVASGQWCDQPLDAFCRRICCLKLLFLQGCLMRCKYGNSTFYTLWFLGLGVLFVITIFQGAMAFDGTGGLFGSPEGNCATKAPLLLDMVYDYWMMGFCCLMILPAACLFLCAAMMAGKRYEL